MSEPLVEERVGALAHAETGDAGKAASGGIHDRGLLLIGLFKLVKAIFFFCVGFGALRLLHKDLGDEAMRLVSLLHFDPEWRLVSLAVSKVDLIDSTRLREIGFGSFAYACLALIEGTGLMLEKIWAEYLTLSLTVMFLPWELFELVRGPSWGRFALLVTNLLVLAYLLWLLQRKKKYSAAG